MISSLSMKTMPSHHSSASRARPDMKITVKGWCPPGLVQLRGKTFAVPSWTEVPNGTLIGDLEWSRPPLQVIAPKTFKVPGKPYVVTQYGARKTCTCPGYSYRKTCKHLALV